MLQHLCDPRCQKGEAMSKLILLSLFSIATMLVVAACQPAASTSSVAADQEISSAVYSGGVNDQMDEIRQKMGEMSTEPPSAAQVQDMAEMMGQMGRMTEQIDQVDPAAERLMAQMSETMGQMSLRISRTEAFTPETRQAMQLMMQQMSQLMRQMNQQVDAMTPEEREKKLGQMSQLMEDVALLMQNAGGDIARADRQQVMDQIQDMTGKAKG